jgi:hypothetical protein
MYFACAFDWRKLTLINSPNSKKSTIHTEIQLSQVYVQNKILYLNTTNSSKGEVG